MRFVDTNVLIYAVSNDPAHAEKTAQALALLGKRDLAMSAQVLQEFYVQATRTTRPDPLPHKVAVEFVESLLRFPIQPVDAELVRAALNTKARFKISYGDAAILEAARILRCDVVLSEDLADGQDYAGVRVENPFGSA